MTHSPLHATPLAHHEPGNEYCPSCDRTDLLFPIQCHCGGLIHRDAESSSSSSEHYLEICDVCGGKDIDEIL